MRYAVLGALVVVLALAAGAGGYTVRGTINVPRRQTATFLPSYWSCTNYGGRVRCSNGDAFPYADLTSSREGGITVKVHRLRPPQSGHLRRVYSGGHVVYVFTAF